MHFSSSSEMVSDSCEHFLSFRHDKDWTDDFFFYSDCGLYVMRSTLYYCDKI